MQLSGRLRTKPSPDRVAVVCKQGSLSSSQFAMLKNLTANMVPEYSDIVSEYEREKQRAKNNRTFSSFPSREHWNPPGRVLSNQECELVCGPINSVQFLKKLPLRDSKTGRWIDYSASEFELKISRTSCSYVAFTGCKPPKFGRIQSLYMHSFISHNRLGNCGGF